MNLHQADLMAQAAEELRDRDPSLGLIQELEDEIAEFWSGYEPTDTEIYRARGGVLRGELS